MFPRHEEVDLHMATSFEWYAFADRMRATAVVMLHAVKFPLKDEREKYALSLLARTLSNFDGAIALHKMALIVEARTLMRNCYENLFYLAALAKTGDALIKGMKDDDLASRRQHGELLFKQKLVSRDTEAGKELGAFLKALDKGGRVLDPKGVSNMGVLSQGYIMYAQASDDAAHPTVRSLSRHTILTEKGGVFSIEATFEDDEPEQTINFTCAALLGACYAACEILGGNDAVPEVRRRADEIEQLQGFKKKPPQ